MQPPPPAPRCHTKYKINVWDIDPPFLFNVAASAKKKSPKLSQEKKVDELLGYSEKWHLFRDLTAGV